MERIESQIYTMMLPSRKAISLFLIISFVFSMCVTDSTYCAVSRDNINLAPPLTLDDIGDDSPHHKNIVLAEIALQMHLQLLAELCEGKEVTEDVIRDAAARQDRLRQEKLEDTRFKPAKIKPYFQDVKQISRHLFMVPVTLTKGDSVFNYMLIFSSVRNAEKIFPALVCSADQAARYRNEIALRDSLPQFRRGDAKALGRYREHEASRDPAKRALDEWLRAKMESGEYAVSTGFYNPAAGADYANAQCLFNYQDQLGYAKAVQATLESLGVRLPEWKKIEKAMTRKPLVIIYRRPGEALPTVTMDAAEGGGTKSVEVRAHSSEYATYVIMDADVFETALNGKRLGDLGGKRPAIMNLYGGSDGRFRKELTERLTYEAGPRLNLPGTVADDGQLQNAITRAAAAFAANEAEYAPPEEILAAKAINLNDTIKTRDFAAGDAPAEDPDARLRAEADAAGVPFETVVALRDLVVREAGSGSPLTLQELVTLLRKRYRLFSSSRAGGATVLRTGAQEIPYDIKAAKALLIVLKDAGLLKDQDAVAESAEKEGQGLDAFVLSALLEGSIAGKEFTHEELFGAVLGALERLSPERARFLREVGLTAGREASTIEAEIARVTSDGMTRRILKYAFFVQGGGLYHAVLKKDLPGESRSDESPADESRAETSAVVPALTGLAAAIDKIWLAAGGDTDLPFSSRAQACFKKILELTADIRDFSADFDAETWYKISCARLFGNDDVKSVIAFYEYAKSARVKRPELVSGIRTSVPSLALYLLVRMMDRESIDSVKGKATDTFEYYLQGIFGSSVDIDDIKMSHGRLFVDAIENRASVSFKWIVEWHRENKRYARAIYLINNMVDYYDYVRGIKGDPEGEHAAAINDFLDLGNEIQGERYASIESRLRRSSSDVSDEDLLFLLHKALGRSTFDREDLAALMSESGWGEPVSFVKNSALVFSERVIFEGGLGAFLPKLARTKMKIIVVATTDEQRALIDEVNRGLSEEEKIAKVKNLDQVTFPNIARYYYYKMEGDPDPGPSKPYFTTFDITKIIREILANLGRISKLSEGESTAIDRAIERFHQVSIAA